MHFLFNGIAGNKAAENNIKTKIETKIETNES